MKRIICRADGNTNTGLGHLYRLFALYEIYKDVYEVVFVTRADTTLKAIPNHYNTKIIPQEIGLLEEPNWLNKSFSSVNDVIIADGYQFISAYQKKIKEFGFYLIYIDDLAQEEMFADIIINHSPYVSEVNFSSEPETKFALGTQYAILRPSFLKEAQERRTIEKIDKAFVCFGGADSLNLSLVAVKALLSFTEFNEIHVVLGGAYKHTEILELSKKHANKLFLHKNLNEESLLKIMKQCNFAIAPSSTICYELCCVKMPILSGYFVDNQELIYKGFSRENAIFTGEDFKGFSSDDFSKLIRKILAIESYEPYLTNQSRLFDSEIKSRFLKLI